MPVKTDFAYVLYRPVSLCTIPQLSFPSFCVSGFVSSLEKNFQKGHTCLTCTSSETKFFSQLVFINRTDYILLVRLGLVWIFFLQVSFPNTTLAV